MLAKIFIFFLATAKVLSLPLDDYVWKDDGHYKYEVLRDQTYRAPGVTSYVLNMTSQKWLTESEVSRSIWWHYLIIHVPDDIDPQLKSHGLLFIDGDDNNVEPPRQDNVFIELFRLTAVSAKTITAVLKNVPNARIVYAKDPEHRSMSDMDVIAYGWKLFLDDPTRPEYLATLPMSKAGVKAMDTVTDFANKTLGMQITDYCVSGASKRGWAAWTTAAADYKRVKCLIPVVYDYLNFVENLHHHFRAYGGWSFVMSSFLKFNLTQRLDEPNTVLMSEITDPLAYKDRLTMPKMITSATGDEYFLLDDSHYYFNQMEGPSYVSMIPNAEHTNIGHEFQLIANLEVFYLTVMKGVKLPKASWLFANTVSGGIIELTVDTKPILIRAWHSHTPNDTRRDFRLLISDPSNPTKGMPRPLVWSHSNVTKVGELSYNFEMNKPLHGWIAFFIQMTFPGPSGKVFECTTETNVIPNTFPFPDCHGETCKGSLV